MFFKKIASKIQAENEEQAPMKNQHMSPRENAHYRAMLSALAILIALAIGSPSLHAACTFYPLNGTPQGGVKLQFITFGDSLLDTGTYQQFAKAKFGGGEFTTNPSEIFIQDLACTYGDLLTPAFQGGFGRPLVPSGGFGYAQGGARISMQPGVGYDTSGDANAAFQLETTVPVIQQLNAYLSTYQRFHSNQFVMINGGANDIFYNLAIAKQVGTPAAAEAAQQAIVQSAIDLASIVDTIIAKGANHVGIMNIPDIGNSPLGFSSADHGQSLTQITQLFNTTLIGQLQSKNLLDKVIVVDLFTMVDKVVANFQEYGFKVSNSGMACNVQAEIDKATALKLENPSFYNDALFCSLETYTNPTAPEDFIFADTAHPSTHMSAIVAKAVEDQVALELESRGQR
jgi:phospholipase/lecithinase/hemolysin